MFGGDMTKMDPFTLSLLTNDAVLAVDQHSVNNHPLFDRAGLVAWAADAPAPGGRYLAVFNATDGPARVPVSPGEMGLTGASTARDLWHGGPPVDFGPEFAPAIPAHGAGMYLVEPVR
jgi:hypothetical protein